MEGVEMIKRALRELIGGILASLCIAIGSSVFLACDNKYLGAVFFSVALLSICLLGFSLFTGKIGFTVEDHSAGNIIGVIACLIGNFIGCSFFGLLIKLGLPSLSEKAETLCSAKLLQSFPEAIIRAFFCGVLMYIAVWVFRAKSKLIGILFCIPVFILCGFEHSIADMFYFADAGIYTGQALLYQLTIVLGNTIGGVFIPLVEILRSALENKPKGE